MHLNFDSENSVQKTTINGLTLPKYLYGSNDPINRNDPLGLSSSSSSSTAAPTAFTFGRVGQINDLAQQGENAYLVTVDKYGHGGGQWGHSAVLVVRKNGTSFFYSLDGGGLHLQTPLEFYAGRDAEHIYIDRVLELPTGGVIGMEKFFSPLLATQKYGYDTRVCSRISCEAILGGMGKGHGIAGTGPLGVRGALQNKEIIVGEVTLDQPPFLPK